MPSRLLARVSRWALFAIQLFCLITAVNYIILVNSDAMDFAESIVGQSDARSRKIGPVQSVELPLLSASGQSSGGITRTELALNVTGSRGKIKIVLQLEGRENNWRVVSSSSPL